LNTLNEVSAKVVRNSSSTFLEIASSRPHLSAPLLRSQTADTLFRLAQEILAEFIAKDVEVSV
jgi:hypothetical protein